MLILTRRGGEAICVGSDIQITILEASGDHVRIGISAPRSVPVVRKELRDDVARENQAAASPRVLPGLKVLQGLKLAEPAKP